MSLALLLLAIFFPYSLSLSYRFSTISNSRWKRTGQYGARVAVRVTITMSSSNGGKDGFNDDIGNEASSKGIIPTGAFLTSQGGGGGAGSALGPAVPQQMPRMPRSPEATRYFEILDKKSPNEMIQKFVQTAPKNIQEAAKSTVMTILGSLPNYALDAAMITTSTKLATLLYQMQITGYMFKNAEYRMTLTKQLKGLPRLPAPVLIKKGNVTISPEKDVIQGFNEVKVRTSSGDIISVDVKELTGAMVKELDELRAELSLVRVERETELRSNMLTYIQALPDNELSRLTSDMSREVVEAIQLLVDTLMGKLGIDATGGPETVVQQSVGALAQLCMWQMVLGYKLRELEVLDNGGFE